MDGCLTGFVNSFGAIPIFCWQLPKVGYFCKTNTISTFKKNCDVISEYYRFPAKPASYTCSGWPTLTIEINLKIVWHDLYLANKAKSSL